MDDRSRFLLNRISERLWVKPLVMCVLSVLGVLLAGMADGTRLTGMVPDISAASIENLLNVMAASMLVIATFAVASMVSAYASASSTATPRSFPVVIADDVSQNALSTFIGAFIFSIVGLVAVSNGYYEKAGRFALFVLTLFVLATVIFTFVRWVDRIARLGLLGTTIDKIEKATAAALKQRRRRPTLRGVRAGARQHEGEAIYGGAIGYVQRVDVPELQKEAERLRLRVRIAALPGTFAAPGRTLAYVRPDEGQLTDAAAASIRRAFVIGDGRTFDLDPRFGFVALSEIAVRALSPAINDPGTAIDVIGTFVRLFSLWAEPVAEEEQEIGTCDRVEVPEILLADMFDDAFPAIAREGAGMIEVVIRLLKALASLEAAGSEEMRKLAMHHAKLAVARAEHKLDLPADLDVLREVAGHAVPGEQGSR